MRKIAVLVLFLTGVVCCKEVHTTENDQMKKVMAIHDEVMPKMGEIGRLVAELRKKIDTNQGGAVEKKAMEDLQDANKSMMDWMRGFGERFDSEEIINGKALTEEKKKWLNEEEEKIKIVKEKINLSIAIANDLLAQYK